MKIDWKFSTLLLLSACSAKIQLPGDGVFAQMETSKGTILLQLEFTETPLTVMSFVGLAEGNFKTPSKEQGQPYFDGLTFHRVEPGFVIQGGDPAGNGSGGPGYNFPNEIVPSLRHDQAGILSMANAGPDTNGSQFFITLAATPFLDDNYSVFGRVVEGLDVVQQIAKGDQIITVSILRQGAEAKAFQPTWQQFQALSQKIAQAADSAAARQSQKTQEALTEFAQQKWPALQFAEDAEGLLTHIIAPGHGENGEQLGDVQKYRIHYTLWAPASDGKIAEVDSSITRGEPIEVAATEVIKAWGIIMPQMLQGERRLVLVPSALGYGATGSPPAIQPHSYLLFLMEMVDFVR